jgi:hypothetical protein
MVSSGCIRLLNQDIMDYYRRVPAGAKVVVLPAGESRDELRPEAVRKSAAMQGRCSSLVNRRAFMVMGVGVLCTGSRVAFAAQTRRGRRTSTASIS